MQPFDLSPSERILQALADLVDSDDPSENVRQARNELRAAHAALSGLDPNATIEHLSVAVYLLCSFVRHNASPLMDQ